MRRALADWGEGTSFGLGAGSPATPGDATWLHTFYNTDLWTNAGGDFSSDMPVTVSGPIKGGREFSFTLGSGAARLSLESFDGTIRLLRTGR